MIILRAEEMGFCFGVRDALKDAMTMANPESVTIHGELVHNETVLTRLRDRGFEITSESKRVQPGDRPELLITAHGISERERRRLKNLGKRLHDTTCPLVTRAHQAALDFRNDGRLVVVVGRKGHIEVDGLTGDLKDFRVYAKASEVETLAAKRIGVLSQTTARSEDLQEIIQALRTKNPAADIKVTPTICAPTQARQTALSALTEKVDFLIVVGGANSNNSKQLVLKARRAGCPAERVSGPADIQNSWLTNVTRIGLTAGTSTPDDLIDAVEDKLLQLANAPDLAHRS
ncbi:MAG: 4-hydroxy-3-methylbut-2-enyl diphosphate reductase [Planctomycetota bacterium]